MQFPLSSLPGSGVRSGAFFFKGVSMLCFRDSLVYEISLRKAEIERLTESLKKAKKALRELSKFLEEIDSKPSNSQENDNV